MRKIKKLLVAVAAGSMLTMSVLGVSGAGLRDIFSAKYYADTYMDLKEAFGEDEEALYRHFLTYGVKEGRVMNPVLDIVRYRQTYGDLDAAFADNWDAYVEHYFTHGIKEKRVSGGVFDPVAYAEAYPDIKKAFGNDYRAIIDHYLNRGIKEGRTAGVTVTVVSQPKEPSQPASAPTSAPVATPAVSPSPSPSTDPAETSPSPSPSADPAETSPSPSPSTDPAETSPSPSPSTDPAEASPSPSPEITSVSSGDALKKAIEEGKTDIKVTEDIDLTERIDVTADTIIDLGECTITNPTGNSWGLFAKENTLTLKNGTIMADGSNIYPALGVVDGAKLVLGAGLTVKSEKEGVGEKAPKTVVNVYNGGSLLVDTGATVEGKGFAVFLPDKDGSESYKKCSVEIKGTLKGQAGLTVNGDRNCAEDTITINGGTINTTGTALYLAGTATTTINSGTISGGHGIEIRAGVLTIKDGTIKGTADEAGPDVNTNGTTMDGVALAVSQHSTRRRITVKIEGGTLETEKADSAVYVTDKGNGEGQAGEAISVEIVESALQADKKVVKNMTYNVATVTVGDETVGNGALTGTYPSDDASTDKSQSEGVNEEE